MNGKLWRFAAAFLPLCFVSAQQPNPQNPQQPNFRRPSPETMRQMAELQQRMREHSTAINDSAGSIQSLDDARKLVNMVADEMPPQWTPRSIRERVARAEYESATEHGSLTPSGTSRMCGTILFGKSGLLRKPC